MNGPVSAVVISKGFLCIKQKTAYEMRINDWSSDVCSSDLKAKALSEEAMPRLRDAFLQDLYGYFANQAPGQEGINVTVVKARLKNASDKAAGPGVVKEIGRASCRESVCQYV